MHATNVGPVVGDETLQLYVRDVVSSSTRPVMELKAFRRVTLAPDESRDVTLTIAFDDLAFLGPDMQFIVEPGEFELMVGTSANAVQTVSVTLLDLSSHYCILRRKLSRFAAASPTLRMVGESDE